MSFQRGAVRPEFGEANQARFEGIERNVVGDAAIVRARRCDQNAKVRQHLGDAFGRKAKGSKNGDVRLQLAFGIGRHRLRATIGQRA